jgi:hypothetical protein
LRQEQLQHNWLKSNCQVQTTEKGLLWSQIWTQTKSLALSFLFEEIKAIKRQKTPSSKNSTKEGWILPLYWNWWINSTTRSDEGEQQEYSSSSSKHFSSIKAKLANHLTQ